MTSRVCTSCTTVLQQSLSLPAHLMRREQDAGSCRQCCHGHRAQFPAGSSTTGELRSHSWDLTLPSPHHCSCAVMEVPRADRWGEMQRDEQLPPSTAHWVSADFTLGPFPCSEPGAVLLLVCSASTQCYCCYQSLSGHAAPSSTAQSEGSVACPILLLFHQSNARPSSADVAKPAPARESVGGKCDPMQGIWRGRPGVCCAETNQGLALLGSLVTGIFWLGRNSHCWI